jgi:hypothetical protein
MRFNLRSLLPQNPHTYAGMRLIRPLTLLVLLTLLADPVMREVAGSIAPVTAVGTPPGAALNAPAFIVVLLLLLLSLLERSPKINSSAT